MNLTSKSCWDKALQIISKGISQQQFDTWFKPLVFESFNKETRELIIRVKSSSINEYIETNYLEVFKSALMQAFGSRIRLRYRITVDSEHHKIQEIEGKSIDASVLQGSRQHIKLNRVPVLDPQLNSHQTFDNFIEGESNIVSRSVGLMIANHPNTTQFNPMFIYGPSGCGKTHLINAIGLHVKQKFPQKRVLYVSAQLFSTQYGDAVQDNRRNDFLNFYQSIDVLIIDDIQEWRSSPKTQDTFFHIFNHLFRNNRRIILASDRAPVDLDGMEERLITRFACGMLAEMLRPNIQLCLDILHSKIRRDGLNIPEKVIEFIAETANGSVRYLEGVVNSLMAFSIQYGNMIDMKLAESVIRATVKLDNTPLTIEDILQQVSKQFNIGIDQIKSKSRKRDIVIARQVSMYIASKYTKMSASRIGRLIGGRDHSTVLHSCAQVDVKVNNDLAFGAKITLIEEGLRVK